MSWQEKQNNSIEDYKVSHFKPNEETKNIYTLFKHYISHAIRNKADPSLLDVGCGISTEIPMYAKGLKCDYVGLDPIKINIDNRNYPFLNKKFEDCNLKYDVFVFSSTLDHFEDIEIIAKKTKELANKGAIAVFMIGLNDRDSMAERFGVAAYKKIFSGRNFLFEWFATALYRLPKMYFYLRNRDKLIKENKPLDTLHFFYFTKSNIEKYISMFGVVTDMTFVRGTNVLYATVELNVNKIFPDCAEDKKDCSVCMSEAAQELFGKCQENKFCAKHGVTHIKEEVIK